MPSFFFEGYFIGPLSWCQWSVGCCFMLWRPTSPRQLLLIKISSSPLSLCPSIPLSNPADTANTMTSSSPRSFFPKLLFFSLCHFKTPKKGTVSQAAFNGYQDIESHKTSNQKEAARMNHLSSLWVRFLHKTGRGREHDSSKWDLYTVKDKKKKMFFFFFFAAATLIL